MVNFCNRAKEPLI